MNEIMLVALGFGIGWWFFKRPAFIVAGIEWVKGKVWGDAE